MADNITTQTSALASIPTATVIATDDCSAAGHAQIIKQAISTDGSATLIPADAANGLDVDVTRLPALVAGSAVVGKVGIDQTTPGTTNLVALAANQSVNNAQINGVTPLMGNGASGTGAQRVTIANDSTGILAGVTTVTAVTAITNALPAGTNTIGKLAANSGVDIGDIDVTSLAASFSHKAYTQSATTALTTGLNALANAGVAAVSAAIDNTTNLDNFMDLELVLGAQTARSVGAVVNVFIVYALDGTNYDDAEVTCSDLICTFPLDAATTARRCSRRDIPIAPGLFKLFLQNSTGQAFAATLNTLSYRTRKTKSV